MNILLDTCSIFWNYSDDIMQFIVFPPKAINVLCPRINSA